jgi:ABC-type multidrug transport system fused ATPase/permease subunit
MANIAIAFSGEERHNEKIGRDLAGKMTLIGGMVVLIAVCIAINSYLFYCFWQRLALNITMRLKQRYIAALMKQEIAYFELNKAE